MLKLCFIVYASGICLLDCSKWAIKSENDNDIIICWHDIIIIFLTFFVSLVMFSYSSKFHVNIITGSKVMTIFSYKGLIRNPEIVNTSVWVFPNIWRLGSVRDTKFGKNVSNKVSRGGGEGGGVGRLSPSPRLRLI